MRIGPTWPFPVTSKYPSARTQDWACSCACAHTDTLPLRRSNAVTMRTRHEFFCRCLGQFEIKKRRKMMKRESFHDQPRDHTAVRSHHPIDAQIGGEENERQE